MKYRKKPVVVEAMKWTGNNANEINKFAECHCFFSKFDRATNENELVIMTLEGNMIADIGNYIIKGVKGEFYPCKPDIFEMTYEKVIEDE